MIRWLVGAALFAVAALAIWYAFQSPVFVAGLTAAALASVWNAMRPTIEKRMTPEQEADLHAATRRAQEWDQFRKRPRDR